MGDLDKLKPVFKKDGTVTAGNSSGLNDGAAMVLIMRRDKAEELGLAPMATIVGNAVAGVDPKLMGYVSCALNRKSAKKNRTFPE